MADGEAGPVVADGVEGPLAGHLIVAVRDLDPRVGGAEDSLATLIDGLLVSGPTLEEAPDFVPCEPSPVAAAVRPRWEVHVIQTGDRGEPSRWPEGSRPVGLHLHQVDLRVEGVWSGLAWRLRNKATGASRPGLLRRHLASRNRTFGRQVEAALAEIKAGAGGLPVVGLTQLDWSAGAAAAFAAQGVPFLTFVRDELPRRFAELYRESIEAAWALCGAGEGLLAQLSEGFSPRRTASVHLPVDFESRFGHRGNVDEHRAIRMRMRGVTATPRITIVGVTPEKGFQHYHDLFPLLAEHWPEVHVDVYGPQQYAQDLGVHPNATWHGRADVAEVFAAADVHMITLMTTGSWGRVINEAGLFGVPTVTSDIGSQPLAVGAGGCAVPLPPEGPPEAREAGLLAWVEALRDVYERREALGEAARDHAAIVDHRRSTAQLRTHLHNLLDEAF